MLILLTIEPMNGPLRIHVVERGSLKRIGKCIFVVLQSYDTGV